MTIEDDKYSELIRAADLRVALRRLVHRTEEVVGKQGLTAQRYNLLLQIAAGNGSATVGELTGRLQMQQTAVTEIVKRAVAAGLVERRPSETDHRVTLLELTPDGERRLLAAFDELESEREAFLAAYAELGRSVRAYRR